MRKPPIPSPLRKSLCVSGSKGEKETHPFGACLTSPLRGEVG